MPDQLVIERASTAIAALGPFSDLQLERQSEKSEWRLWEASIPGNNKPDSLPNWGAIASACLAQAGEDLPQVTLIVYCGATDTVQFK